MLSLPPTVRVFVAVEPVDMRGSFDAHAKLLGTCGAHRISGTVPREGDTPDESASNVG